MSTNATHGFEGAQDRWPLNSLSFDPSSCLKHKPSISCPAHHSKATSGFDVVETVKSLAPAGRRETWTVNVALNGQTAEAPVNAYTNEALRNLYTQWDRIPSEYKSQVLLPIMLRRTPQTSIEGRHVIPDYLALLIKMTEGHIDVNTIQNQMVVRENMVRDAGWEGSAKYLNGRLLSYSSHFVRQQWETCGRRDPRWWDGFSLSDAQEFERGRRLVKVLCKLKACGFPARGICTVRFSTAVCCQGILPHSHPR